MREFAQGVDPVELVRRCRAGDGQAWRALVAQYARLVHSVPVRYGMTPAEVDDVGQEVFAALAQQLARIDDPARLPGWLMTTARRICWRMMQQRRQEQPATEADVAETEQVAGDLVGTRAQPTYAELVAGWDRQTALHAGMARLGERCRQLLTLVFLDPEEPSYDDISAQLAMPKGSIGPTRNRCLAQLRTILEGLGFGPDVM